MAQYGRGDITGLASQLGDGVIYQENYPRSGKRAEWRHCCCGRVFLQPSPPEVGRYGMGLGIQWEWRIGVMGRLLMHNPRQVSGLSGVVAIAGQRESQPCPEVRRDSLGLGME